MKFFLMMLLSLPLLAHAGKYEMCSWNNPGHMPFVGDITRGVDDYTDIPTAVREKLKARIDAFDFDDIARIRRDSISNGKYNATIKGMHFGRNSMCNDIDRSQWDKDREEIGMVFCEDAHCILGPTICRNVSRITKEKDSLLVPPTQPPAIEQVHEVPEPSSMFLM